MFDPNQLLNTMLSSGTRGSPMSDLLAGLSEGGAAVGARPGAMGGGTMGGASGAGPLGDLLGGLMGGGMGGGGGLGGNQPGGGLGGGMAGGGSMGGGGLADLLGGLLGGAGMAGGGGGMPGGSMGGGGMGGGLGDLLGGVLGGGGRQSPASQGGGGDLLGGLLGGLFGGRGGPSRMSGLALIAALAATLLQGRGGGAGAGAPAVQRAIEDVGSADEEAAARKALLLIRGMIAAAKADGAIDAEERRRILGKLGEAGADAEALAFIEQEIAQPLDMDALVAEAADASTAAELYMASMFAIDVDTPAEQAYLAQLAQRLGLPMARPA